MDSFRAFEDSADLDLPRDDEPAIEAPPEIGIDERRMHVRAYNYWVSLLDGRAYPSIEDLEPETLDDFGPHSVLLDFTAGSENPAIAFLGRALRDECSLRGEIRTIADVPSRSLISRLTDHYLQIIANSAPIGFEAEFINERGCNTMYRGILMPLSSDGDTIDFIYGVINWKEVADAKTADGIANEIDRVVAAPPCLETGPVWADGPSGEALGDYDFTPADESDVLELGSFFEEDQPVLELEPQPEEDFAAQEEDREETAPDFGDQPEIAAAPSLPEPAPQSPPQFEAGLADRLAAARESAEEARQSDARSRSTLYRALGQAYAFAVAAEENAEDYAELLADAGINPQARAPMTAVAKLVFGAKYDKTRLAEFAAALSYGRRNAVEPDAFVGLLERSEGGLKGIVKEERQARRPQLKADPIEAAREALRRAGPLAFIDLATGPEEFVLLVGRREPNGGVAIVAPVPADKSLLERAIRKSVA
jgi:hypothetical protein